MGPAYPREFEPVPGILSSRPRLRYRLYTLLRIVHFGYAYTYKERSNAHNTKSLNMTAGTSTYLNDKYILIIITGYEPFCLGRILYYNISSSSRGDFLFRLENSQHPRQIHRYSSIKNLTFRV